MAEYPELIRLREEAISKLKKDYPTLIELAKEWTIKKGFDPAKILWIEACVPYRNGSCREQIYVDDEKGHVPFSDSNEPLGKGVDVNGSYYHLEILVSTV